MDKCKLAKGCFTCRINKTCKDYLYYRSGEWKKFKELKRQRGRAE